jgi:membrane protein implicated in regulation of membrane protease activity
LAAAGIVAWLGHGFAIQILVASVIAAAGCLVVRRMRERQPKQIESQRNADVQIDLGNTVVVDVWQTDRTAQVQYRGAQWSAMLDAEQVTATLGVHSIVAMQGNTLVLKAVTT